MLRRSVLVFASVLMTAADVAAQPDSRAFTWRLIREAYVDSVAIDSTLSARELLNSLDPFSSYFTKEEYERFNKCDADLEERFGISVAELGGEVTICEVTIGSALQDGGVLVGDQILALGDVALHGNADLADSLLSYYDGLVFTIRRPKTGATFHVAATRRDVTESSVPAAVLLEGGLAYVKVTGEHTQTSLLLERSIDSLEQLGMRALVLDLRYNPGGFLNVALDIANLFTGVSQQPLMTMRGRQPGETREYLPQHAVKYPQLPLAVLISGSTCSAAEIISGILQDNGRAILIGEPTLGKCQVMRFFPLNDGGYAYLNVSRYYLPSGRCIGRSYTGNRLNGEVYRVYSTALNLDHSLDSAIAEGSSCQMYRNAHGVRLCGNSGVIPDILDESSFGADHPTWWRDALWRAVMPFIQDTVKNMLYQRSNEYIAHFEVPGRYIDSAAVYAAAADTSAKHQESLRLAGEIPNVMKSIVCWAVWQDPGFAAAWAPYDPQIRIARSLLLRHEDLTSR